VTNYQCGGPISAAFRKLQTDADLRLLPVIGTAMILDEQRISDFSARTFSYLPLPRDGSTNTGNNIVLEHRSGEASVLAKPLRRVAKRTRHGRLHKTTPVDHDAGLARSLGNTSQSTQRNERRASILEINVVRCNVLNN